MAGAISAGAANRGGNIGSDKDRNKSKSTEGGSLGAGTKALMGNAGSYKAPGAAQAADKSFKAEGGQVVGGRAVRGPGNSGTTATDTYSPGAVPVHPWADPATVLDMLTGAVPLYGAANAVYRGGKLVAGEDASLGIVGDMLGADPGPQAGWQPDRTRQMTGGPGGTMEREIAGQRFGAAESMTGDADPITGATDDYSDEIVLQDRRRPYDDLTGEQKRRQLLGI